MDHYQKTISDLVKQIEVLDEKSNMIKTTVNHLCEVSNRPAMYEINALASTVGMSFSTDEFYGEKLAKAVRTVLERRKASMEDAPATVREIFEHLRDGGYAFGTDNDDNAIRGLRVSLGKNVAVFHKLPTGKFGLKDWYQHLPKTRRKSETEDKPELTDEGEFDVHPAGAENEEEFTI